MQREEHIKNAVKNFESLLREQIKRNDEMCLSKSNDSIAGPLKLGIILGDGIGEIIVPEAQKILEVLLAEEIKNGDITIKVIEGLTIENRMALGKSVPDNVLSEIKECAVILKGPTTTPKGGKIESANVTLRRELDLFSNIRPVVIDKEGIDWIFFRENTEGEYILGSKGVEIPNALTFDFKVTTVKGTERIARAAFEYAEKNGKKHVTIVTKANIMKKTDGMFSEICHKIGEEYPGIKIDEYYIDIMAANLINKDIRGDFKVFILPNLYGDIITDEAAQIQGGVGTAGSANIGENYAMFEAIHGSAPKMIEAGLGEYANPSSIFKACEMLLRHINKSNKADKLKKALMECEVIERKIVVTGDKSGATAKEFSEYVISKL